jgi:hypothetical protein
MVQHLMSLIATDQCIQDNLGQLEVGAAPSPADEDPQDAVTGGGGVAEEAEELHGAARVAAAVAVAAVEGTARGVAAAEAAVVENDLGISATGKVVDLLRRTPQTITQIPKITTKTGRGESCSSSLATAIRNGTVRANRSVVAVPATTWSQEPRDPRPRGGKSVLPPD